MVTEANPYEKFGHKLLALVDSLGSRKADKQGPRIEGLRLKHKTGIPFKVVSSCFGVMVAYSHPDMRLRWAGSYLEAEEDFIYE